MQIHMIFTSLCKMEGCPEETWGRDVEGDIIIVLCRDSVGACNNYRIQ